MYEFLKTVDRDFKEYKRIAAISHSAAMSNLYCDIGKLPYKDISSCVVYNDNGNFFIERPKSKQLQYNIS